MYEIIPYPIKVRLFYQLGPFWLLSFDHKSFFFFQISSLIGDILNVTISNVIILGQQTKAIFFQDYQLQTWTQLF